MLRIMLLFGLGCVNYREQCIKQGGTWETYNCHEEQVTEWYGGEYGYSIIYNNGAIPISHSETRCDHRCVK